MFIITSKRIIKIIDRRKNVIFDRTTDLSLWSRKAEKKGTKRKKVIGNNSKSHCKLMVRSIGFWDFGLPGKQHRIFWGFGVPGKKHRIF